jgi:multidrug efflux pump subunit AcrA (membrane-fusion protein)
VVARFAGNVSRNFSPEWAFIPEYGVALLVFKSRIRLLVNFMKLVYLDKKDRVRAWSGSHQAIISASVVTVFLLLPLWHESTSGQFVLEPVDHALVRAVVPGMVEKIFVKEGTRVVAGDVLAKLRNVPLESHVAEVQAQYAVATDRATLAAMRYENYGAAIKERDRLAAESEQTRRKAANLELLSPIAGIAVTARPQDRVGSYLTEGTEVVEIADLQTLRARIYVSEYDMYKVHEGAPAKLQVEGVPDTWQTHASKIAPVSSQSDPTLIDQTKFKGLHAPQFYLVELEVSGADGRLKPGMTGVARVYGRRISLAGLALQNLRVVLGRKIW